MEAPVTKMLSVLTKKVLTHALVRKDSLEMEHFVKVTYRAFDPGKVVLQQMIDYEKKNPFLFPTRLHLDIDECLAALSPCDANSDCANNDGSYTCTCKEGFTGNGTTCAGMLIE